MRVYLYFLERPQNCLSLWYQAIFQILHWFHSAGFCEIIISLNQNQNLSWRVVVVVYFEFWVVISVQRMKCWFISSLFSIDGLLPLCHPRVDAWLRCDGLHRPSFPTLLWDVLHRFGHMETPVYRGRRYYEFERGCCEVHADILAQPSDPGMTA
jgi:hypothetical protein